MPGTLIWDWFAADDDLTLQLPATVVVVLIFQYREWSLADCADDSTEIVVILRTWLHQHSSKFPCRGGGECEQQLERSMWEATPLRRLLGCCHHITMILGPWKNTFSLIKHDHSWSLKFSAFRRAIVCLCYRGWYLSNMGEEGASTAKPADSMTPPPNPPDPKSPAAQPPASPRPPARVVVKSQDPLTPRSPKSPKPNAASSSTPVRSPRTPSFVPPGVITPVPPHTPKDMMGAQTSMDTGITYPRNVWGPITKFGYLDDIEPRWSQKKHFEGKHVSISHTFWFQ